jgi:hypothetical protein
MGLQERIPGEKETSRSTPLGRELHSDLLMVFLGLWDEWEVPMILEDYGVIRMRIYMGFAWSGS